MVKIVNYLFIFWISSSCCSSNNKTAPYEKYADQIINEYAKDMKKKYGLICVGSGGRMANKVNAFSIRFHSYERTNLEEAREMLITSSKMLVDRVNAHEEIRPFLYEYPFTWRGTDIQIAFRNKQGNTTYYLDDSVAIAHLGRRGMIVYDRAEMQKQKLPDFISFDGVLEKGEVYESEVFVDLHEEPYEEALKLVREKQKVNL